MIYILYGPPGSGKTSIAEDIHIDKLTTHTTRDKRKEERYGNDYYFISKEEWQNKYDNNDFLEKTKYHGNYYSLSKKEIEEYIEKDKDAVCVMDIKGVKRLKTMYPSIVKAIYVNIPATTSFFRVLNRENIINAITRTYTSIKNGEFSNYEFADFVLDGRDALSNNTILLKFYMFIQKSANDELFKE